jgi:hypothetical protein
MKTLVIEQVQNGFVIIDKAGPGFEGRRYVAPTLADLNILQGKLFGLINPPLPGDDFIVPHFGTGL